MDAQEVVSRTSSSEADALQCPACGAAVEAKARRCGFCHTELATVRCWRCFDLSVAGCAHCGRCGAALGLEGDCGPTEHRCPGCGQDHLHLIQVGDHRIEECPACTGVFVTHETLTRLTETREREGGESVIGSKRIELKLEEVRYRNCPKCNKTMMRRNFGRRSGVIVDVCKEHGVWFDPNELTAVLEFVATGGLNETRRREADDARADLARLRRQAISEQQRQRRTAGGNLGGSHSAAALLTSITVGLLEW